MNKNGKKKGGLDGFREIFTKKGGNGFIFIGILAGLALIALSVLFPSGNKSGSAVNTKSGESNMLLFDAEGYTALLEEKIAVLLSGVEGINEPRVMVTLESSSEYIFAQNESNKTSESENSKSGEDKSDVVIFGDSKNGESALIVKEIQPKIKGVAVVFSGSPSAEVEMKAINLLSAVLNLPSNRICVTAG